jgi:hypothetical protein
MLQNSRVCSGSSVAVTSSSLDKPNIKCSTLKLPSETKCANMKGQELNEMDHVPCLGSSCIGGQETLDEGQCSGLSSLNLKAFETFDLVLI